ncbi:beta-propeller domain-containing protein [Candidatus Bathyarchaeota archaeon]|nr:beta-propeller domain-containing protein [Candidatus Bathyarchaeota archaeon]
MPNFESDYSGTNVQVVGVDEADIVKTDGEHIYIVSGNSVFIIRAYPAEDAQILSKIFINNTYPSEIFVSGDRLAVLGTKYQIPSRYYYGLYVIDVKTFINIYDISNKTNPLFLGNFTITGSYFNSRMIDEYVYFVASQPAYVIYDTVILPKVYTQTGMKQINASEIYYFNASDDYYLYTTIAALNVQNATEEPNRLTIMMGATSSMYVSLNNIYITSPKLNEQTSIYRIHIENRTINLEAKGTVPGHELNQFSMDEYNDYFRIATATWIDNVPRSNVFILDMNLSMIGNLTDIEPGETLDSARFIGNRCYLATSVVRQDPFFVIDVENTTNPKILGYLRIPGFTRYLHPYDENHIIGVGVDGNNSVKISFFDVTNVRTPIEIDMYSVQSHWSSTPVLSEHKAFLFAKFKDLLALPVSIKYCDSGTLWQGLYVFNITLSNGVVLRGNVTHQGYGLYFWDSSYWVKRAIYIENVLYTVSDRIVQLNSLEDLAFIKEIELN